MTGADTLASLVSEAVALEQCDRPSCYGAYGVNTPHCPQERDPMRFVRVRRVFKLAAAAALVAPMS